MREWKTPLSAFGQQLIATDIARPVEHTIKNTLKQLLHSQVNLSQ